MSATTLEALGDRLDDSLQWRRSELVAVKAQLKSITDVEAHAPYNRALLRGGTALAYAHWEGFTKEACQAYLDFVAVRRLKLSELNDALAVLALDRLLPPFRSRDPGAVSKVLEFARRGPDIRTRLPRQDIVDTRSNLRYEVLADIYGNLGLPAADFDTKQPLIDRTLCDQRNAIAHGRSQCPSPADCVALHDDVLRLLELVRDHVLAAANSQAYLR